MTHGSFDHVQPLLRDSEVPSSFKHSLREEVQFIVVSGDGDVQPEIGAYEAVGELGELCVVGEFGEGVGDEVCVEAVCTLCELGSVVL